MIHLHFKKEMLEQIKEESAPFHCIIPLCQFSTKDKISWCQHYGIKHNILMKRFIKLTDISTLMIEEAFFVVKDSKSSKHFLYRVSNVEENSEMSQKLVGSMFDELKEQELEN